MSVSVNVIVGAMVEGEPVVTIDKRLITPARSLAVVNHSPDGFAWGYGGSGPAQLALAIVLEFSESSDIAQRCHQEFKWQNIAPLAMDKDFRLQVDVAHWVARWVARNSASGNGVLKETES